MVAAETFKQKGITMCLMISKPAKASFHETWLADFWSRNRDGAGVMWAEGGKVRVEKILSPTAAQWIRFYKEHAAGRSCLIHLRMRTHGNIDFDNVHPYEVGNGVWLMHNGILSYGNDEDPSKSDTWHYIRKHLRDAVAADPKVIHTKHFAETVGKHIGASNRFGIMDGAGRSVLVNRSSGVVWGGAWFSNTYAWDSAAAKGLIKA